MLIKLTDGIIINSDFVRKAEFDFDNEVCRITWSNGDREIYQTEDFRAINAYLRENV